MDDEDEYQPPQQSVTTATTTTHRRSQRLAERRKQIHNPGTPSASDSESKDPEPQNGFADIPENFYDDDDDDDADDVLERMADSSKQQQQQQYKQLPWWFYASTGCVAFVSVWSAVLAWVYFFTKTMDSDASWWYTTIPFGALAQTVGAVVLVWCWGRSDDYTVKEGALLTFFSTFTVVLLHFLMIRWYVISIWNLPSTAWQPDTATIRSISDDVHTFEVEVARFMSPAAQWVNDSFLHPNWWMDKLGVYMHTWMEFD